MQTTLVIFSGPPGTGKPTLADKLARQYHARFRPIYVFVSDDQVWEGRVSGRYDEMNNPDFASWERIQHQRARFREWQPDTALFIDSLNSSDRIYESVSNFVTTDHANLKPLQDLPLVEGKYH